MLRYKADIRTVIFMVAVTGLLVTQWILGELQPVLFLASLFMAVPVAVITHNHNHLRLWKSNVLNACTDYWLTLFYGYPAFAWIPTHNANHHKFNNREGDYTITYRFSEGNNLLTLLTYPSISGAVQSRVNILYLKEMWRKNRRRGLYYLSQFVVLIAFLGVALYLDWRKALLYIVIPQQVSLFAVLVFNYIQHVHCDEQHAWNHSRNFVGWGLNAFLFNNGYHTVHHLKPGMHWSQSPRGHAEIAGRVDPTLHERSFWWFMFRSYILGLLLPAFRTRSMRLDRMARERELAGSEGGESAVTAGAAA